MRNPLLWAAALVGLGMAGARADEEKIPLENVPKAVVSAIKARFPGATIRQAEKDVDEGKTFYEIEITHAGRSIGVVTQPDGKIVAVEKTIPVAEIPAAISGGIKAKYPKAQIKSAEEIEEVGVITYEVVVEKVPGKEVGMILDRSGKILDEEGT